MFHHRNHTRHGELYHRVLQRACIGSSSSCYGFIQACLQSHISIMRPSLDYQRSGQLVSWHDGVLLRIRLRVKCSADMKGSHHSSIVVCKLGIWRARVKADEPQRSLP